MRETALTTMLDNLLHKLSALLLSNMAKGSNDIILRDRLQFDIVEGATALVYGRIDLSDYVSIPENKGLAIKEIRFQLRTKVAAENGVWPLIMTTNDVGAAVLAQQASVKMFATTTAYELAEDVGIASPNVICVYETLQSLDSDGTQGTAVILNERRWFGTPDLHPEGYDVVTDLLIGIACDELFNESLRNSTAELDIMIIAEPKKITQKDLTQMLTQAQDL